MRIVLPVLRTLLVEDEDEGKEEEGGEDEDEGGEYEGGGGEGEGEGEDEDGLFDDPSISSMSTSQPAGERFGATRVAAQGDALTANDVRTGSTMCLFESPTFKL